MDAKAVSSLLPIRMNRALVRPAEEIDHPTELKLDAIVVPTVRAAENLRFAAELAQQTDAILVVFCSGASRAEDTSWLATSGLAPKLLSVGLTDRYAHPALEFASSKHRDAAMGRRTDTSLKRNLGLLLGRSLGWRQLLFLDDDVHGITPVDVLRALQALAAPGAVGFYIDDFPDHSVVGHASRIVGTAPQTFVSGGALVVDLRESVPFFPTIYNEDWLFLYEWTRLGKVYSAGHARQLAYEPFDAPARAYGEEFGDILAEGLHQLVYHNAERDSLDPRYWSSQLAGRQDRIECTARLISASGVPGPLRSLIHRSLRAALERQASLRPESFVGFLHAWRADLRTWQARLSALPTADCIVTALRHLDLRPEIHLDPDQTQPFWEG